MSTKVDVEKQNFKGAYTRKFERKTAHSRT